MELFIVVVSLITILVGAFPETSCGVSSRVSTAGLASTEKLSWVGSGGGKTLGIVGELDLSDNAGRNYTYSLWELRTNVQPHRWGPLCTIPFKIPRSLANEARAGGTINEGKIDGTQVAAVIANTKGVARSVLLLKQSLDSNQPESVELLALQATDQLANSSMPTCVVRDSAIFPADQSAIPGSEENLIFLETSRMAVISSTVEPEPFRSRLLYVNISDDGDRILSGNWGTINIPPALEGEALRTLAAISQLDGNGRPRHELIAGLGIVSPSNRTASAVLFVSDPQTNRSAIVQPVVDSQYATLPSTLRLPLGVTWLPSESGGSLMMVAMEEQDIIGISFTDNLESSLNSGSAVRAELNRYSASFDGIRFDWGKESSVAPFRLGGKMAMALDGTLVTFTPGCTEDVEKDGEHNISFVLIIVIGVALGVLLVIVAVAVGVTTKANVTENGPSTSSNENEVPSTGPSNAPTTDLGDFHDPTELHSRMVTLNVQASSDRAAASSSLNADEEEHRPNFSFGSSFTEAPGSVSGRSAMSDSSEHRSLPSLTLQFQLGRPIGHGGFGTVYEALDVGSGQLLAVKEFMLANRDPNRLANDLRTLRREIETMKSLRHPHIVRYYGAATDETRSLFLVMELMGGGSVHQMLQSFGALDHEAARSIVRQLLLALAYMHEKGLLHRDVKCANLLVGSNGEVKLGDFGTARHVGTVDGLAGTPNWMAPEVIREEPPTAASDMWAVGCVVMELLTGLPPFAHVGTNFAGVMSVIGDPNAAIVLPALLNDPHPLHDIARQCLERDPAKRPTAEKLLEDPFFIELKELLN